MKQFNYSQILPANEIRNNIDTYSKSSGVYHQYIDHSGLELLEGVKPTSWELYNNTKVGLVYIGKASDMQYRLRWHLGLVNTSHSCICHGTLSTLRHSYMANNKNIHCLSQQQDLDAFIDSHVFIKYFITEDYENIEDILINEYSPPLNIKGNSNLFIKTNKERRKIIKNSYRSKFQC